MQRRIAWGSGKVSLFQFAFIELNLLQVKAFRIFWKAEFFKFIQKMLILVLRGVFSKFVPGLLRFYFWPFLALYSITRFFKADSAFPP